MNSFHCREIQLKLIYQRKKIGIVEQGEQALLEESALVEEEKSYVLSTINHYWKNHFEINSIIDAYIDINWKKERFELTLSSIVISACSELVSFKKAVLDHLVDDSIQLSKKYCSGESHNLCFGLVKNMHDDMMTKNQLQSIDIPDEKTL